MRTILSGGDLITPELILKRHAIIIEGETITEIVNQADLQILPNDQMIDIAGKVVCPGFIDIHTHGGNQADAMDANPQSWDVLSRFFAQKGVTGFLLTTGSASKTDIDSILNLFQEYEPPDDGAVPLGIHLEGPYLNPAKKGAQPGIHLRNPDPVEYQTWFKSKVVKLMTIAPELPGALECIRTGREQGVEFAVGHTAASYQVTRLAVEAGLRHASHTFNAMPALHHRHPGVVGVVLSDPRIFAQIIPDGVHLHPAVVQILLQAKGFRHTVLITDSIQAAGQGDGSYQLFEQQVTVSAGEARISDGALAGSVLTMDQGLRFLVNHCEIPLFEAVFTASTAPASSLKMFPERGGIQAGARADLVVLTNDLSVDTTVIGGRIAYQYCS